MTTNATNLEWMYNHMFFLKHNRYGVLASQYYPERPSTVPKLLEMMTPDGKSYKVQPAKCGPVSLLEKRHYFKHITWISTTTQEEESVS